MGDGVTENAVMGAVVVTVTVTSTEEDPSKVTDVFERVHVDFVGAPAHINWTVPVNPAMGAKVGRFDSEAGAISVEFERRVYLSRRERRKQQNT
jgi:hypothetical protein